MVLADVDGISQLFANIEALVGISIEKIITESKAKATRKFTKRLIRGPKGTLLNLVGLDRAIDRMGETARIFGYGQFNIIEMDWKNNLVTWHLNDPYSLPLMCGDLRGATEAIRNVTGEVTCQKLAGGSYFVKAELRPRPSGLEERLTSAKVNLKSGDLVHQHCRQCGLPTALSDFIWDMDKGTINNAVTGLRFAFVGPNNCQGSKANSVVRIRCASMMVSGIVSPSSAWSSSKTTCSPSGPTNANLKPVIELLMVPLSISQTKSESAVGRPHCLQC
jgi:hypothetical protein